jgi:hypothetical protein
VAKAELPGRYLVRTVQLEPFLRKISPSAKKEMTSSPVAERNADSKSVAAPSPPAKLRARPDQESNEGAGQNPSLADPAVLANPAPEALAQARLPKDARQHEQALQALIVPDSAKVTLPPPPLPQIVLWQTTLSPKVEVIVPPPPQVSIAAMVSSLRPPNQEMHIADLQLSATKFPSAAPLPAPSNTAPVSSPEPTALQRLSTLLARQTDAPTPANLIASSTIQVQSGPVLIPLSHSITPDTEAGSVHPGSKDARASEGAGTSRMEHSGLGTGDGSSARAAVAPSPAAGNAAGPNGSGQGRSISATTAHTSGASAAGTPGAGADRGAKSAFKILGGDAAGSGIAPDRGGSSPGYAVTRMLLPKDGRFGMVVIGNSSSDEYPESANIWRSRMAYSVYLQVGTAQKWILQYALPASEVSATAGGRLEAPWPYDISRPSIDSEAAADAILVHGLLTASGKLEDLTLVFPAKLAETPFLLRALQLWEFRPALRNGQPAAVEVLLIIPPAPQD